MRWRLIKNWIFNWSSRFFLFASLIPFLFIFGTVIYEGADGLNWNFFTKLPAAVGEEGGGVANAIVGTLYVVGLATLWALPLGILLGLALARDYWISQNFCRLIRSLLNLLLGVPSIVMGIFSYTLIVLWMGHFSVLAGGFALGMIAFPIVTRNSEEVIRSIPEIYFENAFALGLNKFQVFFKVILPMVKHRLATGALLAIARISGESAPLLFTSFNNQFWSLAIDQSIATLPIQIFNYAISPFPSWQQLAWSVALVLLMSSIGIYSLSRYLLKGSKLKV